MPAENENQNQDAGNQNDDTKHADTERAAGRDDATGHEDVSGLKSALGKERDARKTAETELATLRQEKQDREAAEQKRKEKEAADAGKFEELAATRERERDAAKTEAATLKGENDQLRAAISTVLDAEWKALPAEVRDAYLGADDDPLAKLQFLPKGKALAAKLAEKGDAKRGNGHDPKSSGNGAGPSEEDKKRARRMLTRAF